jgi:secreted trypsin-like serine protease
MKTAVLVLSFLGLGLILNGCAQAKQGLGENLETSAHSQGIIGGDVVSNSNPISQMVVGVYNNKLGALCTGSILSSTTIISAAHCVEGVAPGQGAATPQDLVILFSTNINDPNRIVRAVSKYRRNPRWYHDKDASKDTGDLSIIHFEGGLPAGFQPATVLTDATALQNAGVVTLAGYGINTGHPVANMPSGAGVLRQVDVPVKAVNWDRTEVLMDQTNGKGACHGDSGGPAYVNVNGQLLLFGVTSRGVEDPNNSCNVDAAYTNILPYATWIAREIKALDNPSSKPTVGPGLDGE